MISTLQASAILILWRSGKFDTADIAHVLGGGVMEPEVVKVLDLVRARERGPDLHFIENSTLRTEFNQGERA